MDTFLPPIEKAQELMMKLAYRNLDAARLPSAFGLFYSKINKLDKKLLLSPETALLP